MTRRQTDACQKIAAALSGGRLIPDQPAAGGETCLQHLPGLSAQTIQTSLPQRRLKDVVQSSLDPFIGNVVLPDEAKDSCIEHRNVPFPISQGPTPVFRLFIADLGKGPSCGVVDDIVNELIGVSADARVHPRQQRRDQQNETAFHLARAKVGDELFPVPPLPGDIVEHGEEDDALNVYIGPPGAPDNVPEFAVLDPLTGAVEGIHDDGGRRQIEALGQGRRGDGDLEDVLAQETLDLLAIGRRQGAMVKGHPETQAFEDGAAGA